MPQLAQVLTDDQLPDADRVPAPLPTIWTVPDDLWARIAPILAELDPPKPTGRSRIDPRAALDAILYRLRTGVQWNHLPQEFPDDSSVHRTFQRWQRQGVFARIWADVLTACDELGGVDWEWQAVDGSMGKARMGGISSVPTPPTAPNPA
jgi:putative transposase